MPDWVDSVIDGSRIDNQGMSAQLPAPALAFIRYLLKEGRFFFYFFNQVIS